jgi:hypothetical protein
VKVRQVRIWLRGEDSPRELQVTGQVVEATLLRFVLPDDSVVAVPVARVQWVEWGPELEA